MKWLIFIWLLLFELFFSGCANPNAKLVKVFYKPLSGVVRYNGNARSEAKSRVMAINEARAYCNGAEIEVLLEEAQEVSNTIGAVGNRRGSVTVPITTHDRLMFMAFKCVHKQNEANFTKREL